MAIIYNTEFDHCSRFDRGYRVKIIEDRLWTWVLPDGAREVDRTLWKRNGGKWIIFDQKDKIIDLAGRLEDYIASGDVESAKYWNKDPSALCVYALDRDREKVRTILDSLGAGRERVWEYDYAWDKNFQNPVSLFYSQASKFRTILQSYGCMGALQLIRETVAPPSHDTSTKGITDGSTSRKESKPSDPHL